MAYLGVPPQSGFITTAKQRITSSTNNYVDLDHSISSLADVIVWVNFVKQDSTNLTLTTSSRITLGGTLVSSDIVEIAYLGKAVATQTPATGTVTNDMLVNSSITLNGSAVSLGGSASVGFDNTPLFFAHSSTGQSVSTGTWTKVTLSTEVVDTDNAFASSKFTIPSDKSGKYMLQGSLNTYTNNDTTNASVAIYKNGSVLATTYNFIMSSDQDVRHITVDVTTIDDASVGDYYELYGYISGSTPQFSHDAATPRSTNFLGYKLIT
jgi:hypothetical protein